MAPTMNSRERFRETMRYGRPDRVPYLEETIRQEVFEQWRRQGMPPHTDVSRMFAADRLENLEPNLDPIPKPAAWPTSPAELREFRRLLDPGNPARLPEGMPGRIRRWKSRDHLLMLYVHEGLFLSMGVRDWRSFVTVATHLADDPAFVQEFMEIKGQLAARVAERLLRDLKVDAAIFSEPIGANSGPLISPEMYETLVLPSYEPVLQVLRRHSVSPIIFKTFANARRLLPSVLKWGFNCLWACANCITPYTCRFTNIDCYWTDAYGYAAPRLDIVHQRQPSGGYGFRP